MGILAFCFDTATMEVLQMAPIFDNNKSLRCLSWTTTSW